MNPSFLKILLFDQILSLMRKNTGLTQIEFAKVAGVGPRIIRDLEQGKATVRIDKVNDVLDCFGCQLGPIVKQSTAET